MRKFIKIIALSVFLFFLFLGVSFADEISQKQSKKEEKNCKNSKII